MKFDVITIGGITEDIMFYVEDMKVLKNPNKFGSKTLLAFEDGNKIISDQQVVYTGGGGGANTAISFARLGLKTGLIAALGQDQTAVSSLNKLSKEKINTSFIKQFKGSWSGLSLVVTGKNQDEHIIFSHRAANEKLKIKAGDYKNLKTVWFYLASLSGPFWKGNLKDIFNLAAKKNSLLAWNPGAAQIHEGVEFLKPYFKKTDVLIVNREEAISLCLSKSRKLNQIKDLLAALADFGPNIIAITNGAEGAWVLDKGQIYFESGLPVKVVNSTGAGDAFGSSLIGGLILYKNDIAKALKLALIRSSIVVTEIGAQEGLLKIAEIKSKYKI